MSRRLDWNSVPRHVAGLREKEANGDLIVYRDSNSPGLSLNSSGARIWRACDGASSARDVRGRLERQHALPDGALAADVADALRAMAEAGFLELLEVPSLEELQLEDSAALVRPREDGLDVRRARAVFEARWPAAPDRLRADGPRWIGGAVRIAQVYETTDAKLVEARCDHPHLEVAEDLLARWPVGFRQVQELVRCFQPLVHPGLPEDARGFLRYSECHSSDLPARLGAIWSTVNCPFMLAENLVHEAAHQKLFLLGLRKEAAFGWIENPQSEGYPSPVLPGLPRPMTALAHGLYAYLYVTEFDLAALESEPVAWRRERIRNRLERTRGFVLGTLEPMRAHLLPDRVGAPFFAEMAEWARELLGRCAALPSGRGSTATEAPRTKPAAPAPPLRGQPVRVFVGTDPRQEKAELALAHSLRKHTSGPLEIVWMDYSRGEPWSGWRIGRERGSLPLRAGPDVWATEFTCYRFAIPEVCDFEGRAIYLDSDMLAVGDLRPLFELEMTHPVMITEGCPATMLIDCAAFRELSWWPSLARMKQGARNIRGYLQLLIEGGLVGELDARWNCRRWEDHVAGVTRIVHYTARGRQPWMPYPECFRYRPPESDEAWRLWWRYYLEAWEAAASGEPGVAPPLAAAGGV